MTRRGHGNPRRGMSVSSRRGWGPAASEKMRVDMAKTPKMDRRSFLKISTLAGGGFAIGVYVPRLGAPAIALAAGALEPNVWGRIIADDTVRVMPTMLDMGQGVMTSMPMLVAEELVID